MGPLKSSIAVLKSSVGVAAQRSTIYQGLEHALKAALLGAKPPDWNTLEKKLEPAPLRP